MKKSISFYQGISSLSIYEWIGVLLLIASTCLLIPGLILPMATFKVSTPFGIVYEDTKSYIELIKKLFNENYVFLGILITLFAIIIPIIKILLLYISIIMKIYSYGSNDAELSKYYSNIDRSIFWFNDLISRWAMADIFATGVLVAYLIGKTDFTNLNSTLHSGYYFFIAYVLLSITLLYFIEPIKEIPAIHSHVYSPIKTGARFDDFDES